MGMLVGLISLPRLPCCDSRWERSHLTWREEQQKIYLRLCVGAESISCQRLKASWARTGDIMGGLPSLQRNAIITDAQWNPIATSRHPTLEGDENTYPSWLRILPLYSYGYNFFRRRSGRATFHLPLPCPVTSLSTGRGCIARDLTFFSNSSHY